MDIVYSGEFHPVSGGLFGREGEGSCMVVGKRFGCKLYVEKTVIGDGLWHVSPRTDHLP
jgi:hypothetical protein